MYICTFIHRTPKEKRFEILAPLLGLFPITNPREMYRGESHMTPHDTPQIIKGRGYKPPVSQFVRMNLTMSMFLWPHRDKIKYRETQSSRASNWSLGHHHPSPPAQAKPRAPAAEGRQIPSSISPRAADPPCTGGLRVVVAP